MTDGFNPLFKTKPPGNLAADGTFGLRHAIEDKAETLRQLEAEERMLNCQGDLPFLYGWKWYEWARRFYDSRNKINLLCAANQISKSSTQIRKAINWATNQDLWPDLWPDKPVQFWYLYPTKAQVNAEFETKWKQFLPTGEMKEDEFYGWKVEKYRGDVLAIHFNSGVHIYFKTYAQDTQSLQTGTCDAIFCDEELPLEHYEELMFRISASNGYFHMVFTATLGQDFWRRAMEPGEQEVEELPGALKQTISLYEAMHYEDGSPSRWTAERIAQVRARCSTHLEVLKRVYGKFIVLGGLKYEQFDIKRHMKPKHPLPHGWLVYSGVDIGSGGVREKGAKTKAGHPSAICFIAVKPDFRQGRVFLGWRGDNIVTTSGDVVEQYIKMKKEAKLQPTAQYYDWSNKDFQIIAGRNNEPFEKAEKGHDIGEDVINTLFKNDMMFIYEDEETIKLGGELATLLRSTRKEEAMDDFADAFRYAVTKIPWDWSVLSGTEVESSSRKGDDASMNDTQRQIHERRKAFDETSDHENQRIEDEFEEWNEAYGTFE
jgi:hypothetical protein